MQYFFIKNISLREAGVLGASPKCAFFLRRSKSALLAKSLQQIFPAFCLPKRKAPADYAGANFHLMKLQIILQARSFLSPLFGSESQAALLSAAQSVFRLLLFFSQSKRSMQRTTLRRFQWHQCRSCSKKHSFMDFFMHRTLSASYKTLFC